MNNSRNKAIHAKMGDGFAKKESLQGAAMRKNFEIGNKNAKRTQDSIKMGKNKVSERQVAKVKKEYPDQPRKAVRNNLSYYSEL